MSYASKRMYVGWRQRNYQDPSVSALVFENVLWSHLGTHQGLPNKAMQIPEAQKSSAFPCFSTCAIFFRQVRAPPKAEVFAGLRLSSLLTCNKSAKACKIRNAGWNVKIPEAEWHGPARDWGFFQVQLDSTYAATTLSGHENDRFDRSSPPAVNPRLRPSNGAKAGYQEVIEHQHRASL